MAARAPNVAEMAKSDGGPGQPSASLPAAYRPADIEPEIYAAWLAADVFAPDGTGSPADLRKQPFVIIQPPPNVTGALHLGHAARTTVEDLMIRRARMQGRPTLWLPGVDHASIAAHLVLDKIVEAGGREPREPRPRALPRAHVAVHGGDARRHRRAAPPPRRVRGLVARALHHGRGLGQGRAHRLQAALRRRPGVPRREAHQLVPGLPDQPLRPGGDRHPRARHALVHPLSPAARRTARPIPTTPSRSPPRARRPSSATRPWPSIRTMPATRRWSGARS